MPRPIIVIEDDAALRLLLEAVLTEEGYATRPLAPAVVVLAELRAHAPAAVILDLPPERREAAWGVLERLRVDPILGLCPRLLLMPPHAQEPVEAGEWVLPKPFHSGRSVGPASAPGGTAGHVGTA